MTHTKGPWVVYPEIQKPTKAGKSAYYEVESAVRAPWVAKVQTFDDDQGECEANARLVAAAPDLLEACKEWVHIDSSVVSLAEQRRRWEEVVGKMKAAIAKAECPTDGWPFRRGA